MSDIEIEKGVAIPPPAPKHNGKKHRYPFAQMEVGDSFVVPLEKHQSIAGAISMINYYGRYGQFTKRYMPDHIRVWRIEARDGES
jgi:hypothetical protein